MLSLETLKVWCKLNLELDDICTEIIKSWISYNINKVRLNINKDNALLLYI